jgi:hypothetical protein
VDGQPKGWAGPELAVGNSTAVLAMQPWRSSSAICLCVEGSHGSVASTGAQAVQAARLQESRIQMVEWFCNDP